MVHPRASLKKNQVRICCIESIIFQILMVGALQPCSDRGQTAPRDQLLCQQPPRDVLLLLLLLKLLPCLFLLASPLSLLPEAQILLGPRGFF